ncbi:hypothetical protein E5163_00365 [Marinicauda algicola]|uniref:Lytic transglycosylase domain-containing protein n=1 Tax=Marinicauda algicola TaxID=2029849 RepID=A0A4S2H290_9PROT|nr:hypothetical protein [Marinicauda algicola]TGY89634.1 hypothetical protein E5163_00365 [Marinicauda algicola]
MVDAVIPRLASPAQLLQSAADATGADFDYLVRTAARESNFDPQARAQSSSAAGMFQFIEQTWLAMMSRHGAAHGQGELAAQITRGPDGRFEVADPATKREILDLRFDPALASRMAGELAAENAGVLREALGREPSGGELYAAHFLGAGNAARLIETAEASPAARADTLFPAAARANRAIFFDGARARSVSEVLGALTGADGSPVAPPETLVSGPAPESPPVQAGGWRPGAWSGPGRPVAVLSPGVIELLASLDAPRGRDDREA